VPKVTENVGKPYAEIGTLLRNLRLRRGLSQFDLATAVGINNSYLSRIENGERRPSPKILKKFADALRYSYDELVVTSGILTEDFVRSTGTNGADGITQQLQERINHIQNGNGHHNGYAAAAEYRQAVPVYDTVPAGITKEATVVETHADVHKLVLSEDELASDPRAFALVVKGDSMVEAGIFDGDIVVVSPTRALRSGDIGVVQVGGSATTVKRIYLEGERVILQAANWQYKPQVLAYPEEVEILGKVILVRRKL
jgi:SOS-response transcriptional repressor LexA